MGLITAVIGTTYTNIIGLHGRFFLGMAISMSIMITASQVVVMFLEFIPPLFRLLFVIMIIISSSLAINTMESKEITGKEDRLETDPILQKYTKEAERLDSDYNNMNILVSDYVGLRKDTGLKIYNEGATTTRIQRDSLFYQKTRAWAKVDKRRNELLKKGTKTTEAFINVFYSVLSFLNFSEKSVEIITSLLFSIINDSAIPIFSFGLTSIYGNKIMIPSRKRKKNGRNNGNDVLSPVNRLSIFVRKMFGKVSEGVGIEREIVSGSAISGEDVRRKVWEYLKLYGDCFTDKELGILVGQKLRRKPFSRSYICDIRNGKS